MKKGFLILALVSFLVALAQSVETHIAQGNNYYKNAQFDLAEAEYRMALQKDPTNETAQYNLQLALYRQKKYKDAETSGKTLIGSTTNREMKSKAYYNEGVMYTRQQDLETAIESYKNALRITPDDQQARENLQKALRELKKQQQDKQNQQQSSANMSQSQADQKLKQLQEKEKELQEKLQKGNQQGTGMDKDW